MTRGAGSMAVAVLALALALLLPVHSNAANIYVNYRFGSIPRMEVLGGRIGQKAWLMGGYSSASPRTVSTAIEEYSYDTNTWTTLSTTLPISLHHGEMAADPDNPEYLYITSGYTVNQDTYTRTFWRWDGTSFLTSLPQLPIPTGAASMQIMSGKIYVIGGALVYNKNPTYATLQIYTISTMVWSRGANMTYPREHLASGQVGTKLYAIGGRQGEAGTQIRTLRYNEEYNTELDTWSTKASMPTGRSGCHGETYDGWIYVFGGDDRVFDNVEAYNPSTDTWKCHQPLPYPRHGMGIWRTGDLIYLGMGGYAAATTLSGSFFSFNVTESLKTARTCTAVGDNDWTNWVSSSGSAVSGVSYYNMLNGNDYVYNFGYITYDSTTSTGGSTTSSTGGGTSDASRTGGVTSVVLTAVAAAAALVL